jgi:hypothetical protein
MFTNYYARADALCKKAPIDMGASEGGSLNNKNKKILKISKNVRL